MSRIYLHTRERDAEVRGSERAYMGASLNHFFLGCLSDFWYEPERLKVILPSRSYLRNVEGVRFAESFAAWMAVPALEDKAFLVSDESYEIFATVLNTALVAGSDPLKLMARIHGQCETHCYIEGQDRQWLADIIKAGCEERILRGVHDAGQLITWGNAVHLLEDVASHDHEPGPVVFSYSVCDSFPNPNVADWEPPEEDEDDEAWYDLADAERWDRGMAGLRGGKGGERLCPEHWGAFRFSEGTDAFQINAFLRKLRNTEVI